MKKLAIFLAALAFAVPAFAGINVSVFGGYTTLNLKTLNNDVDTVYNDPDWAASSPDITVYRVKFGNALNVGFDAMYSIVPSFSAGVRCEYVMADNAGVDWTDHSVSPADNWKFIWNASLLPVMAGISYNYAIAKTPVSLGLAAYGGWGFGFTGKTLERFGGNYREWVSYAGGAPVADLLANASYKLDGVTVSFQAGYRVANIQKMRNTDYAHSSYGYWPSNGAGAEFTDYYGVTKRNFDFSGLLLDIKAGIEF